MARDEITRKAYEAGGYRERYAMDNYLTKEVRKANGHKLWIFRYSPSDPYQDANGATYDTKRGVWVN